jgi:hypothetical protein
MPRIYNSASEPFDFCRDCFPDEEEAFDTFGNTVTNGEGPDGRGNCFGYDCPHPDWPEHGYTCDDCGAELTALDN